jgi:hypothetical protein
MLMVRTNTATRPDISAVLTATGSASASGGSGHGPYVLFLVTDDDDFLRIRINSNDLKVDVDTRWIDHTFAVLEARLSSPPDQDLLDEAEQLALRLSSTDKPELSDEWIEAISAHWSKFRD